MLGFWSAQWWIGVGGLLQAIAAITSIVVLKQGKDAQRQSVRVEWAHSETFFDADEINGQPTIVHHLRLQNVGLGIAREIAIQYIPNNGHPATICRRGNGPDIHPLPTQEYVLPASLDLHNFLWLSLGWFYTQPLNGYLEIKCTNQMGERLLQRFLVTTLYHGTFKNAEVTLQALE